MKTVITITDRTDSDSYKATKELLDDVTKKMGSCRDDYDELLKLVCQQSVLSEALERLEKVEVTVDKSSESKPSKEELAALKWLCAIIRQLRQK